MMGMFWVIVFHPPKNCKPTKQAFCIQENCIEFCVKQWKFVLQWAAKRSTKIIKAGCFAKKNQKTPSFRAIQWIKKWKSWVIMAVPKIQELEESDQQMWFCSGYPFRHRTRLHCAERKASFFAEWITQHLMLEFF